MTYGEQPSIGKDKNIIEGRAVSEIMLTRRNLFPGSTIPSKTLPANSVLNLSDPASLPNPLPRSSIESILLTNSETPDDDIDAFFADDTFNKVDRAVGAEAIPASTNAPEQKIKPENPNSLAAIREKYPINTIILILRSEGPQKLLIVDFGTEEEDAFLVKMYVNGEVLKEPIALSLNYLRKGKYPVSILTKNIDPSNTDKLKKWLAPSEKSTLEAEPAVVIDLAQDVLASINGKPVLVELIDESNDSHVPEDGLSITLDTPDDNQDQAEVA